ncbi:MAG: MBL fold metallo-hydrolase [Chloroflexota bacterium]
MTEAAFSFTRLQLSPYNTNSYLLMCQETRESLVIDAPGEAEKILRHLEGTKPKYILMTHSHHDHVLALNFLKRRLGVPVACHPDDAGELPLEPDVELHDSQLFTLGHMKVRVLHTPGHTRGSCCFLAENHLFSGDTLFPGGPGWTASPEDLRVLLDSLARKVFVLPDDTEVHPGHGEGTTLGYERGRYSAFASKPLFHGLCGNVTWDSV